MASTLRFLLSLHPTPQPIRLDVKVRAAAWVAWETDRRTRIEEKAAISVEIDSLVISLKGQAATASFQQTYSADKLREKSRKTLELQRVGGRWLIRKEGAGG